VEVANRFYAVDIRQAQIHYDHVKRSLLNGCQGLTSGFHRRHTIAVFGQMAVEQSSHGGLVVHDQNTRSVVQTFVRYAQPDYTSFHDTAQK